jgi:acyl dehydratase
LDYDKVLNWQFEEVEQLLTPRDCKLYALSVGLGRDALDERELPFVAFPDPLVVPTMATVIGWNDDWVYSPLTGVDAIRVVHGETKLTFHAPLRANTTIINRTRIRAIVDKGVGKGALVFLEAQLFDKETGKCLCVVENIAFCRGDGGCGGPQGPTIPPHPIPDGAPDRSWSLPTQSSDPLFYCLNGDQNPLHWNPEASRSAGFPRPILHGLATFGMVTHGLLKNCSDFDAARVRSIGGRFSAPVFPGETITTDIWRGQGHISFRAYIAERKIVVFNNGRLELS